MDRHCSTDCCDGCPAKLVCRCLRVTEAEVVAVISTLGLQTVKEVRQHTGAGDGCTCCHRRILKVLEQHGNVAACA